MAHYQIAETLTGKDLRIKGVQNEYDSLPENPYLERFFDKYSFILHDDSAIVTAKKQTEEAPSKPLASQEQEQEQEHSKPPSRDAPFLVLQNKIDHVPDLAA